MIIAKVVVRGVAEHFAIRLPEWFQTAMMLSFAWTLLGPGDTFGTSPSYATMAAIAPEEVWGAIIAGLTLPRMLALILNGSFGWFKRASPWVRTGCAFTSAVVWFVLSMGFYFANPASTGAKTYFWLSVFDALIAVLIAKDIGTSERRIRNERTGSGY